MLRFSPTKEGKLKQRQTVRDVCAFVCLCLCVYMCVCVSFGVPSGLGASPRQFLELQHLLWEINLKKLL